MRAPPKDWALHQCGCFDREGTCFGAVGHMPCLTIHNLLEYLLSQIFEVSIDGKEIREMGASMTPNLIFSHCTETNHYLTWSPNVDAEAAQEKRRELHRSDCAPQVQVHLAFIFPRWMASMLTRSLIPARSTCGIPMPV